MTESVASDPKVAIRRVNDGDVAYLCDLRNRLAEHFLSPLPATPEKTFDLLLLRGLTWVLAVEGRPVGCYSLYNRLGDTAEFGRFMLEPDVQGNGYGRLMLSHAIGRARQLGVRHLLLSAKPEARACGLYAEMGFQVIQVRMEMRLD